MPGGPNASQKANQRARNGTRSGSSGQALAVRGLKHLEWEEVESDVEHITDLAAKITHTQIGTANSGYITANIVVPAAYAHEVLDAALASQDGVCYVRLYKASLERFMQTDEELENLIAGDDSGDSEGD